MKRIALMAALLVAPSFVTAPAFVSSPAHAAEECEAKSWGLSGQKKECFSAKVVDLLCEVAGDCPPNCGAGNRQLGLLRADNGKLVYPQKNLQQSFNGPVADLHPHCGKTIDVRGWFVGDEDTLKGAAQLYQVQWIRSAGGDWKKASKWTKDWAKKNPGAKGKGPWFRRDPRVKAQIEKEGFLGLGRAADVEFAKDEY